MSKKTNNQPGFSINGNIDTGGGDIAAGDINKRDVFQTNVSDKISIHSLFQSIYPKIQGKNELSSDDKEDLSSMVKEVEQAVTETEKVDMPFIERRLRNIGRMAPDILDVVVKTLANPIIGFTSIAQKIAQKAENGNVKKKEKQ